jgi:hypothetical protein
MLPKVNGKTAKEFFRGLSSGEFTIMDVAEHIDRENTSLKSTLSRIANSIDMAADLPENREDFDIRSFIEGMLLTYGILHFQESKNNNCDPDFVRPDRFWDGNEWFTD